MLNHSAPTTTVVKNLHSIIRLTCPQVAIEELPNEGDVRKSRGMIRIIAEECATSEVVNNLN